MTTKTDTRALLHKTLVQEQVVRSCLNCDYWGEYVGVTDEEEIYMVCGKVNQLPPPEIIVYGCDQHCPDIGF